MHLLPGGAPVVGPGSLVAADSEVDSEGEPEQRSPPHQAAGQSLQ